MHVDISSFQEMPIKVIKDGYVLTKENYTCLICGETFKAGEVYSVGSKLYEGSKAIVAHIKEAHGTVLENLLSTQASALGITELQKQLLTLFASGMSDKEVAQKLEVAGSTIRNHKSKLREKEKQAKLYIAIMELIEELGGGKIMFSESDSKENEQEITPKQKKKILDQYITETGTLRNYPASDSNKQVVLEAVVQEFNQNERYNECEVNQVLSYLYTDYQMIKEDLLNYGYLARADRGDIFWVRA